MRDFNKAMRLSKIVYGFLLTSALCAGGCSMDSYQARNEPENILVEPPDLMASTTVDGRELVDPLEAHMRTRKQVDPKNLAKSSTYTKHAEDYRAVTDSNFRVVKLERQVDELNPELDEIMTSIQERQNTVSAANEVAGIEEFEAAPKMKAETILTTAMVTPPVKPQPQAVAASEIQPSSGSLVVSALRTGEHPGRTRLVLDVNGTPHYKAAIDNAQKVLLVTLSDASWTAQSEKVFAAHPMVRGYKASKIGSEVVLAIALAKPAKLTLNTAMKPNEVHGDRVVLDITAL